MLKSGKNFKLSLLLNWRFCNAEKFESYKVGFRKIEFNSINSAQLKKDIYNLLIKIWHILWLNS